MEPGWGGRSTARRPVGAARAACQPDAAVSGTRSPASSSKRRMDKMPNHRLAVRLTVRPARGSSPRPQRFGAARSGVLRVVPDDPLETGVLRHASEPRDDRGLRFSSAAMFWLRRSVIRLPDPSLRHRRDPFLHRLIRDFAAGVRFGDCTVGCTHNTGKRADQPIPAGRSPVTAAGADQETPRAPLTASHAIAPCQACRNSGCGPPCARLARLAASCSRGERCVGTRRPDDPPGTPPGASTVAPAIQGSVRKSLSS